VPAARRPPDHAARTRALDPVRSFLVQAPAGSGKTGLLVQRYLVLLARVAQPEEVLAITFTRKAAGEMRDRVVRALRAARGAPPAEDFARATFERARGVLARDAEQGWALAEQPGRLRVQTIDSLCAALVRQMPWLARFGGEPRVVEDAGELYREAARETVALVWDEHPASESVATLLRHLDDDVARLQALLVEMLARRDQWLRNVTGRFHAAGPRRAHLEAALARAVERELAATRAAVPEALAGELAAVAAAAAAHLRAADAGDGASSPLHACRGLDGLPGTRPGDRPAWEGIAELLLTRAGRWRRSFDRRQGLPPRDRGLKLRAGGLRDALCGEETLRRRLARVRDLPPTRYQEAQWAVLGALATTLEVAAGLLRLVFSERGAVDFVEVAHGAVQALGEADAPTDLALALDHRVRHVLVDEFQDTSHTQVALLERLTAGWEPGDGRSLFLVGDPMQSVYRFREADVGLYLRAADRGIGSVALEPLRLSTNFRSRPALVEWVNAALPRVLPARADVATGAVPFAPADAFRSAHADAGVTFHAFVDDPQGEREARAAARLAAAACAGGAARRVAVLVRARAHLRAILPRLRAAGLRYRGVEIDPLADRPVVQDLMALTRAIGHPADRVAWLAVLRAPWCGLTLEALLAVAASESVADGIEARLAEPALGAPEHARLARTARVLGAAVGARGTRTLRRVVEGAWCALGGPACVDAAGLADARAYLDLLESLEPADALEPARLAQRVARLHAPAGEEAADVEIMTVHRAKGLEFDTVILPGLGREPAADEARLLGWAELPAEPRGTDLLLAPIGETGGETDPVWRYLRDLEREKTALEAGRLLYVACTRARESLHLLGGVRRDADGAPASPPAGSLLALLWDSVSGSFEEDAVAEEAPALALAGRAPPLRRLPAGWEPPAPPAPAAAADTGAAPVRRADATVPVAFEWAGPAARHTGTLVHRLLCRMADEGPAAWHAARLARARRGWRGALLALGVPAAQVDDAVARVERALGNVLADPRGRWLLDPGHRDARSEHRLTGMLDGRLVHVALDRTFVDEAGTRWIVDFKTGSHEGGDVAGFLDRERERYRDQLERYARLMRARESRPLRLALYFPLLAGWREWAAPELPAPSAGPSSSPS